ncbi:MAG TPA: hypothetical protein VN408_43455 [Actinoplanes sp.]|nr:hypothetical protein [Actinoplanes sp.]
MRMPVLVPVAIVTTFLAGCTGAEVTPTDAALAGDTAAICAQARRTSASFAKTLAEDRQLPARAGEEKARAREKVTRDVANFSYALLDMSKLAGDPVVKEALATMGAEVAAVQDGVTEMGDERLAALRSTLDEACGRG